MATAALLLWGGVSFAGGEMLDQLACFSTPGPDRYADGTIVADGECYALVWSPAGTLFSGFNADGTTVSSTDRVVLAAPLAKDGKCQETLFQIPAATYAELAAGEWAVCLVDTRTASGVPAGVANNVPLRVNRWGTVKSGVKISPVSASALSIARVPLRALAAASGEGGEEVVEETGVRAVTISEVPESAKTPKITSFTVEDGVVRLTVEDTMPYLVYTISAGDAPDALAVDGAADKVDGDVTKPIALTTEATESSRFFRVTRAE